MNVSRRMRSVQGVWLLAAVFGAGCSVTVPNTKVSGSAEAASAGPERRVHAEPKTSESHAVRPIEPSGGLVPMAGDPDARALEQVRLVPTSCDDLEEARQRWIDATIKEMRRALAESFQSWHQDQPNCWQMYAEEAAMDDAPAKPASAAPSAERASSTTAGSVAKTGARPVRSASGTNNQVAGVDEADIVKHDGQYVYFAVNGALRIASIDPPRLLSVTKLAGQVKELFVENGRAVVYSSVGGNGASPCTYGYDCAFAGDGSRTMISVYTLGDRTSPRLTRKMELSGSLMAARRIGNAIHTVVSDGDSPPQYETWPGDMPYCGVVESAVKARFKRLSEDNERRIRRSSPRGTLPTLSDHGAQRTLCENLTRTALSDGTAFTTVVSFDLGDDQARPITATVQSRPGAVFVSESALYLSVAHQRGSGQFYGLYAGVDEVSDIHKFRIGARPSDTRYLGSGVVPGHVLNQFAMDEWYGYLRIATTRGRVPDPNVESQVSILADSEHGNLIRTGAVEHLAPGEDIRAVRFDSERGYVVTFKKTDPLFVLDLSRPHRPVVLGELKIPGFSTYMHRIDQNHLLSIGLDANDHGDFAYFDGVILQLFDVTQPTVPKLLHKEKIGTRGSSSEAITNHLAFNYFQERGLLAIPMTICEGGGDGYAGNDLTFAGLLVYDVSVKDGFHRLGGVNHGTAGSTCGTWWSQATSQVKRSLFLDDWVWSMALDRVKVQKLTRLGKDVADMMLM
jgi:hypothetical protein